MTKAIQYLKRNEIDIVKWDSCISDAENGLIYSYSWYLDHMAENWDALILNDYEAVMPLTWRRKYGIKYLYQPSFCQQLGIFGNAAVYKKYLPAFLEHIKNGYSFAEIFLNYGNDFANGVPRNNFILSLHDNYEKIYSSFKGVLKRNLSIARKSELNYQAVRNYKLIIEVCRQLYGKRFKNVNKGDYINFENLCAYLFQHGNLIVRQSVLGEKVVAASILLNKNGRLYLMMSFTPEQGRAICANHFHLNEVIKEFCNRGFILDFEGSDIPGIAYFYESFGTSNTPYYYYRYNRLPYPLRWLKG